MILKLFPIPIESEGIATFQLDMPKDCIILDTTSVKDFENYYALVAQCDEQQLQLVTNTFYAIPFRVVTDFKNIKYIGTIDVISTGFNYAKAAIYQVQEL